MIETWNKQSDIDALLPLLKEWHDSANSELCNVEVSYEKGVADLRQTMELCDGSLIVSIRDSKPVGFLAIFKLPSALSDQIVGFEKYWYTLPAYRHDGVKLFRQAEKWCKEKGCSHLVMCASNLASDMHDKTCRFYELMGMTLYETTYIKEVN